MQERLGWLKSNFDKLIGQGLALNFFIIIINCKIFFVSGTNREGE